VPGHPDWKFNCDMQQQYIYSAYSPNIRDNNTYADVVNLLKFFKFPGGNDEQVHLQLELDIVDSSLWPQQAYNATCKFLRENPALWTDWIKNSEPDVANYREIIPITQSTKAIVYAFSTLFVILSVCLNFFLHLHRNKAEIKSSALAFCQSIVCSSYFAYTGLYLIPYIHVTGVCQALPLLFGLGFNGLFGCLFLKSWRVFRIFNLKALKVKRLSNLFLLQYLGYAFLAEILVNIVWLAIDQFKADFMTNPNDYMQKFYICQCSNFNIWLFILLCPKAAFVCASLYLAYQIRQTANKGLYHHFNESMQMFKSLIFTALTIIILVPIALSIKLSADILYIMILLGVFAVFTAPNLFLFVPKFGKIYKITVLITNDIDNTTTSHNNDSNTNHNKDTTVNPFKLQKSNLQTKYNAAQQNLSSSGDSSDDVINVNNTMNNHSALNQTQFNRETELVTTQTDFVQQIVQLFKRIQIFSNNSTVETINEILQLVKQEVSAVEQRLTQPPPTSPSGTSLPHQVFAD
jgi:hypothetical protein